jgi:hypothetical protein
MTVSVPHALQSTVPFHGQVNSRGFSEFADGQIVSVKVLRRLNEQHYVVELRGQTREVQSEHVLPVGETIDAVVVSAADKLELRQLTNDKAVSESETSAAMSSLALPNQTDIASQANFYKCKLSKAELRTLQQAVDIAPDPNRMSLAGLFLSKRGMAIDPVMLQQLYAQQTIKVMPSLMSAAAVQQASKETDSTLTVAGLAQALRSVIEIHAGEMMHSAAAPEKTLDASNSISNLASDNTINSGALAEQVRAADDAIKDNDTNRKPANITALHDLLSDVDANGLGVRYGTLPVLINGELVELELVMFKQRQKETDAHPVQRLVMSIHTQSLGTVSITAEALNQRLLVNISAETTDHAETLGTYARDVRALAERFGWAVESVAYEVKTQSAKLSQRVMEQSIRQGVIDHVW